MNKKRYVQHISGQGEKWEIVSDAQSSDYQWVVRSGGVPCGWHFLPKSEYRLCELPEEWEDVTGQLVVTDDGGEASIPSEPVWAVQACNPAHYRLRKIDHLHNGPCFIIERKKS